VFDAFDDELPLLALGLSALLALIIGIVLSAGEPVA
jgi:hypothetical protein